MERLWNEKEDECLRNGWMKRPTVEIVRELGRPVNGCTRRAQRLRLPDGRVKWSEEEIELLTKEYPLNGGDYVADKLKRDVRTVYTKAHGLGIIGRQKYARANGIRLRKWTEVTCSSCGVRFERVPCNVKDVNFCSHACRGKAKINLGKANPKLVEVWKTPERRELHRRQMKKRWEDPLYRSKMSSVLSDLRKTEEFNMKLAKSLRMRPTKPEKNLGKIIEENFPGEYKYNGDFSCETLIGGLIPDYINVNGKKHVVELFGSYWHDPEQKEVRPKATESGRRKALQELGYRCTIIWDHELDDESLVVQRIRGDLNG